MTDLAPQQSISAAAYEALRRDVISCRLLPGDVVTELEMSKRYGFGKTPIREGLARLSQDGLVRILPRRGYLVTPINVKDVQDVFEMRLLLEPEAAARAAGLVDGETLRLLDQVCAAGYDPADPEMLAGFLRANTDLHVAIARASGNQRLAAAVVQLLWEMERVLHVGLRLLGRSSHISRGHQDLTSALLAGDGRGAREISAARIGEARQALMDGLLSNPHLMSVSLAG